ncbi:glycosyltransferase [Candidatus Woesearchaeota archaeon]|nr:glycosyltransferase [Candidatus Woesearchaeota archaeon]
MQDSKPNADILFEASWEVCNKVGGIYTVVKSKADIINRKYNGNYFLVGPLFPEKAKIELQQCVPLPELKQAFDELEQEGLSCIYGKWMCKGEPQVILVDFSKWFDRKNDIMKYLWESYGIDSLFSGYDFIEPMIWGHAVGRVIEKVKEKYENKRIVAHFHEWLAGFGLLYLKHNNSGVKTVFTTHATMLGRALCGSGVDLYSKLSTINPEEEAKKSGINDKFTTERACAKNAEVFTTVSEITAIEAEKILGRKADVLLLNGLDIDKFPTFEESSIKHREYRDRIREFLSFFFFPHYKFDLEKTLNFFIVGRYEFKNKGIDILIKALGKLNSMLKQGESKKNVAAFFFIPTAVTSIKMPVLENREQFEKINEFVKNSSQKLLQRLLMSILKGDDLESFSLFSEDERNDLKKYILKFNTKGGPFLSTHNIYNEENDLMIRGFKEAGLLNREEDRVKVILFPVYLDGFDEILKLKYYDAIQGCHMGIFPSYYEPWGYTPLESAALGVPAITTDLAGFGRFIKKSSDPEKGGIFVLNRMNKSDDESENELTNLLHNFTLLKRKDRVEQKMSAKALSELADWKNFARFYIEAHNLSLTR